MGKCQEVQGHLDHLRLPRSHLKTREMRGYLEGVQGSCTSHSVIIFVAQDRSKDFRESRKTHPETRRHTEGFRKSTQQTCR